MTECEEPRLNKPCQKSSKGNGKHRLYTGDNRLRCSDCGAVSKLTTEELIDAIFSEELADWEATS